MKRSLWGWMLCCILTCASLAFSQTATTSLRGVVKDPTGALVPGATVTITAASTGISQQSTSNGSGIYEFQQIRPARYTIKVNAGGFGQQTKSAELLVNQPATIDFNLSVQASTVTVDVSATAQTLNTSDASLGNSADNAEIEALPSETRNVPDLLSLQPGVLYLPSATTNDSRTGAVNGGRSDQGNVTIDGVDDNDQVGGYAFTGVLRETQDSIEEFRVTTGGGNADEGRSSGAQIAMVTKSGTNRFHGAAYEFNRTSLGEANNYFNEQAQVSNKMPNTPPKLIRNIYGADVGGPIKKDKLFFFGNYEASRIAENAEVIRTTPTSAYDAGNLTYTDGNGNNQVLSPTAVAALDAGCEICKTSAYPNPPGDNPNALGFFKSMPAANGNSEGDGLNEGSFAFSSPNPVRLNTSIGRLDWIPSDKNRIFVRGNLQDDSTANAENFPGQPPASTLIDDSKGVTAGETWTINTHMVNDIRYGYIRQGYASSGIGVGDYVDFRFLSSPTAESRTSVTAVPVNNVVDDMSWTKGNHTFQFGYNWRLIHQNHSSDSGSFNSATTNPYWLGGNPPTPGGAGVGSGFFNSYEIAYANLVGTVPQISDVFNYKLTSSAAGVALGDGVALNRHFIGNEYEGYAQDAWRIRPNFTFTFGVRYTLLDTPYEANGQEVAPTIDTHTWFLQRETAAKTGQIYEPDLSFTPAGSHYGKPNYWPRQTDNFAPRVAFAYSPDNKTSIRLGAGIYYDHYGEALVNQFDQNGSFGMSSSISNPAGVYGYEGNAKHLPSPRFISRTTFPNISVGNAPTTQTFPYLYPQDSFAITWGLDSQLKTPYSEALDFSVQREVGKGFTIEGAYVGRLGRHLIQQLDLAEPVDYVDPGGGGDYYAAGTQLSHDVDLNTGGPGTVQPIKYFEDIFSWMAGYDYAGESATQAVYNNEWMPYRANLGATTSLSDLDFYAPLAQQSGNPFYPVPAGYKPHFWQDQFSSLYAFSTIGNSYYHAGQLTLRHPTSHGITLDVSYTWSHSIDFGSDTERSSEFGGAFSEILNTWKPYLNKGSSDFDTRQLITTDWVYQLPFGTGKFLGGGANHLEDAIIGGWQWSGIQRWTTGLPFSLYEPGWSTDWQIESYGVATGPLKIAKHFDSFGNPQFFAGNSATTINNNISCGGCNGGNVRLPYPGEAGDRNNLRGDGYSNVDTGINKSWGLGGERGTIKFAWETYNVLNTVKFDPASIGSGLTGGNLGIASSELSVPRRMQFALRYDF
ncbi:MAG: TonB-dependent receptor [Terracidiphilus sp.]